MWGLGVCVRWCGWGRGGGLPRAIVAMVGQVSGSLLKPLVLVGKVWCVTET